MLKFYLPFYKEFFFLLTQTTLIAFIFANFSKFKPVFEVISLIKMLNLNLIIVLCIIVNVLEINEKLQNFCNQILLIILSYFLSSIINAISLDFVFFSFLSLILMNSIGNKLIINQLISNYHKISGYLLVISSRAGLPLLFSVLLLSSMVIIEFMYVKETLKAKLSLSKNFVFFMFFKFFFINYYSYFIF